MSNTERTLGQEIIRTGTSANVIAEEAKQKFAELYDWLSQKAMDAQTLSDNGPTVLSPDSIAKHIEIVRVNEELMRCVSESCKLLELAAMWAVKGIIA